MAKYLSNLPSGNGIYQPAVAITSAANILAWDVDLAQNAKHTMTENTTLQNPTNMKDGQRYRLRVTQGAVTAYTLSFGSAYEKSSTLPAISTALGAEDIFIFDCDGTTMSLVEYSADVGA